MHVKTVQIEWHGNLVQAGREAKWVPEPIYSLDFHPSGALMTAGGDKEIRMWKVEQGKDGYAAVDYTGKLHGHDKTVNCVRFSPSGDWLASSGDGGEMYLWKQVEAAAGEAPRGNLVDDSDLAPWRRAVVLRGHNDDIMDVSWSCDGTALVSGSIDNKNLVWDMTEKHRGKLLHQLRPHSHYTQGVAWDPAQQFIVTQSADRTCMVHALRPAAAGKKGRVQQQLLPASETAKEFHTLKSLKKRAVGASGGGEPEAYSLFQDECIPSFFRRLAWSPDGSFLVVPAGQYKTSPDSKVANTAYVYARNKWSSPLLHLPGHSKPVLAVRFCPVIFKRDEQPQPAAGAAAPSAAADGVALEAEPGAEQAGEAPPGQAASAPAVLPFDLPYKMVFSVATLDSVVLYSTESVLPLAVLGQLHYDSITDLTWSSDGRMLAASSRDCYCSIACFDAGELGTPMRPDELPPHIAARMAAAQCRAPPIPAAQGAPATAAKPSQRPAATPAPVARSSDVSGQPTPAAVQVPEGEQQGPGTAPAAAQQAVATAAGGAQPPAKERKRIQPEPVAAVPGSQQLQQLGGEAKRKRITPEAVGPAPAVVGDSQAGTQVFASAPSGEQPNLEQQQQQPAAKKPKRIVPQQISELPASAAPGGSDASGAPAPHPSHDASAAGQPAAGSGGAKPAKRITPILVTAPAQQPQQQQQQATGPSRAAAAPTESGSMVGAAVAKQAKRITPTPIKAAQPVSGQFESAKQVLYAPPASESSRDGCGGQNVRRITPVPLSAASPLPQVVDSDAAATPRTAPAAGGTPAGFNIAALAMAAGKKAALQGKGQ